MVDESGVWVGSCLECKDEAQYHRHRHSTPIEVSKVKRDHVRGMRGTIGIRVTQIESVTIMKKKGK